MRASTPLHAVIITHLMTVQPNPDNRPVRPSAPSRNAPNYEPFMSGEWNGAGRSYRYGGNRRGNLQNNGVPRNGAVKA